MIVAALTGKVKYVNTGKTQYKVETLLNGKRSGWVQTYNDMEKVKEYIDAGRFGDQTFLVTEVTTRTIGVF